jgi:heat shock protein HtpX
MARKRPTLDRDRGLTARMTGTVFLLGLIYVIFFVVLLQGVGMALPFVILIAGGLLAVQYWTSDKIALASAGARIVEPNQAPELYAIVQRLCMTAGLPMPRIAIVPTDMPNAFATGRSPKHAVVAVTQGLLDRLEPRELEGVLAHELSHVAHRDVAIMTMASFFAMVAGFITRWGFYFGGMFGGGFGGGRDDNNNSGLSFMVILLVSVVVYAISFVLVKITGAMGRIPQRDMRMAEGLNQFFIIPAGLKSGISTLVADHPPLEARLEQLRKLERQLETL